jgi:hypothetical protein
MHTHKFVDQNTKGVFSWGEKSEKCIVARFDFIWQIMSNHGLFGSKVSSRDFPPNCAISFFRIHLMLHACAVRFVTVVFLGKLFQTKPGLTGGATHLKKKLLCGEAAHIQS